MDESAVEVSPDKTRVALKWASQNMTLSADQLQELIGILAHVRANMQPAIPNEALKPGDRASVLPALRWYVCPDAMAPTRIRLWILHPGFGWMFLPLDEQGALELHVALPEVLDSRPKLS